MKSTTPLVLALVMLLLPLSARAGPATANTFLPALVGHWQGTVRTWFRPEKLEDESKITGEFVAVLDGRIVRHVYTGSMQGTPRTGEELLAYNTITELFQASWIDDFHTNHAILFSEGPATARGFAVLAHYEAEKGQPRWGWRTEYELIDADHLHITSYNILPEGQEYIGVQVLYERVK